MHMVPLPDWFGGFSTGANGACVSVEPLPAETASGQASSRPCPDL